MLSVDKKLHVPDLNVALHVQQRLDFREPSGALRLVDDEVRINVRVPDDQYHGAVFFSSLTRNTKAGRPLIEAALCSGRHVRQALEAGCRQPTVAGQRRQSDLLFRAHSTCTFARAMTPVHFL